MLFIRFLRKKTASLSGNPDENRLIWCGFQSDCVNLWFLEKLPVVWLAFDTLISAPVQRNRTRKLSFESNCVNSLGRKWFFHTILWFSRSKTATLSGNTHGNRHIWYCWFQSDRVNLWFLEKLPVVWLAFDIGSRPTEPDTETLWNSSFDSGCANSLGRK